MVVNTNTKLNYFPSKYRVSKYYSPRMIMHTEILDYKKHCNYTFGSFVQAYIENNPTNTQSPRLLDCIYLRPAASHQGGNESWHIPTNWTIIRNRITETLIPEIIIQRIHSIAQR